MRTLLTKEQYERLLEIVFAGNWLLNGWRDPDSILKEYQETTQHLFSLCGELNANDLVVYLKSNGEFFPSNLLEEKMFPLIEAYNENTFMEELIVKLVKKEFSKSIAGMTVKEKIEIEEKYVVEIRKNGVDRLCINWV